MDPLTELLHDAVEDVEPTERLAAIRQRTRRRPRRWATVGGAVLVTAAVVTGVAILAQPSAGPGPGPATSPSGHAVAVYYPGETPHGERLFREFHQSTGVSPTDQALLELSSTPEDPDYTTYWTAGQLRGAEVRDDVIQVEVDPSLTRRCDGVPASDIGIQQAVYTLQAAVGARLPVRFVHDGAPVASFLCFPAGEPIQARPQLDVLALVSISNPREGRVVEGSFSADGVASSFEGTVAWELRDATGKVVREYSAQGTMEDHLTPWATGPIDVSGLPPGRYVFEARTDDPTGPEDGGPTTDTRTVVVR